MFFLAICLFLSSLGITIVTGSDCICVIEAGAYMKRENTLYTVKELPIGECYQWLPDPAILPTIRIKHDLQVKVKVFQKLLAIST